jgi:hypothetical protein
MLFNDELVSLEENHANVLVNLSSKIKKNLEDKTFFLILIFDEA